MTTYKLFLAVFVIWVLLVVQQLAAQTAPVPNSITVSGSRFTYDLLRQWIQDFNEEYPDAVVQIVPRETPFAEQADLVINAHDLKSWEVREGYEYIKLGRYVIFPVANELSATAQRYKNRPIGQRDLKELYFDPNLQVINEEPINTKKAKRSDVQLYTRERIACSNTAFARFYGFEPEHLKGKTLVGEDKHLLYALSKDTTGVSYSIPGIIYDLKTKKVKNKITVLKTESLAHAIAKDKLDVSNLDSLVNYLEQNTAPFDFPVVYFHISLKKTTPANATERKFLQYVLTKGQQRLHEFGFLNPEEPVREKSIELVAF